MASARKKQDEKNIKVLRDLASLSHNKYCFDCNQRGPTYVNVTIGSFVCTKCSGILRGLTPPHRVKSISMASFTPDEIELLKSRGNEYCRRSWLGLYEGAMLSENSDEQAIRDFMVDKYERKRYYLDPATSNGFDVPSNNSVKIKNSHNSITNPKIALPRINGMVHDKNNKNSSSGKQMDFIADFGSADIYNAVNANKDNNNLIATNAQPAPFANFDNNPIFSNNSNNVPSFNNLGSQQQQQQQQNPTIPSEDRYAALKDLDNAFKTQPQLDWNPGSNSSSYNSPGSVSSIYSSSSQASGFKSPNQISNALLQDDMTKPFNPFNGGVPVSNGLWNDDGNHMNANPFKVSMDVGKMNGFSSNFCSVPVQINNGNNPWAPAPPNPFKVGAPASSTNGFSNNPFL